MKNMKKNSIFCEFQPKAITEISSDLDILRQIPLNRKHLRKSSSPKTKPGKPGINLFTVFENKENNAQIPKKNMEISVIRDFNDEIAELKELREKNKQYENKIDSLITQNSRISNKLEELKRLHQNNVNSQQLPPNIEKRIQELLNENKKLAEIVKKQGEKIEEFREKDEINGKIETDLQMKEEIILTQARKIEGLKKEIAKSNKEKSQILEELMELKLLKNSENEISRIKELKEELEEFKIKNLRLNEVINSASKTSTMKKEGSSKKLENLHETFDNLAKLNQKLNDHLDAIQVKSGRMAGFNKKHHITEGNE